MDNIHVVKRDGSREPFDANKINLALVKASEGLEDQVSKVVQVASEVQLTLFDGITTEQLDEAVIQAALQNVKDDPDFDTIAATFASLRICIKIFLVTTRRRSRIKEAT